MQQALLALDSDNRTLRRKLADAGAVLHAALQRALAAAGFDACACLRCSEARAEALQAEKDAVGAAQAATLARRETAVRARAAKPRLFKQPKQG